MECWHLGCRSTRLVTRRSFCVNHPMLYVPRTVNVNTGKLMLYATDCTRFADGRVKSKRPDGPAYRGGAVLAASTDSEVRTDE